MGEAPAPVTIGDVVLERYRVIEQVASGGHSVVYRGEDTRLARPVCIKVFSGIAGKSGIARTSYEHFVQEAFALSRLTHPNTLRIYDFGHLGPNDADGAPVQVCEYMNGGTLSNVVREKGAQTVAETVRVMGAMCAALAEAHALGIVHRDIKPQNILFATVGTTRLPKLADFGIAKWHSDEAEGRQLRAEDTAIVAGQKLAMYSPSWAAPEQLAGQEVNGATDIYSLAVVALYMLSTQAVFADEDVYAGYKKRRRAEEMVRGALDVRVVGPRMIDVLVRALAFEPSKRTAKVDELGQELANLLDPETGEIAGLARPAGMHRVPDPFAAVATPDLPSEPPAQAPTPMPTPTPPWMAAVHPTGGASRVLSLTDQEQQVSDRRVFFIHSNVHGHVDLTGPQNTRVRVSLLSAPGRFVVNIKAMTCFIAHLGGRPSPAVQLEQPGDVALVTPRAQEIAHIRVAVGTSEGGQTVFVVGTERVAVRPEDCADPILFDFGPGSDAYFVYTRGRAIPRTRTR